jgi:sigma-E factor negative regulatory protein RseB
MNRLLSSAILLFLTQLAASTLHAQPNGDDVRQWLQKMVKAVHTLNYEGTFVHLHDNHLESMRVVHTVTGSGERERLISLNGAPREVVRDNASVTCVAPDSRLVSVGNRATSKGFSPVFSVDIDQLEKLYELHLVGDARIAGRESRVVAIVPRDDYRYGYRLYLDKEHALPVKTDMLNNSGVVVSQVMFTELRMNPDSMDLSGITMEGKEDYQWVQQRPVKKTLEDEAQWRFKDLPRGFVVTVHAKRPMAENRSSIDHFVLSDGLASLSVYIEKATEDELRGSSQMGAVNAYGSLLEGHQITVVGEVPAKTVRSVAGAILLQR